MTRTFLARSVLALALVGCSGSIEGGAMGPGQPSGGGNGPGGPSGPGTPGTGPGSPGNGGTGPGTPGTSPGTPGTSPGTPGSCALPPTRIWALTPEQVARTVASVFPGTPASL
jgi:hypothetical protein